MNDNDPLHEELRCFRPAAPPDDFLRRLITTPERVRPRRWFLSPLPGLAEFWRHVFSGRGVGVRIAATACALILAGVFLWARGKSPGTENHGGMDFAPDSVTLSQEVLARYDGGIVQAPDGEAFRLTCYDRVDRFIFKDTRHGSVMERREPEREIVPVPLEVY